MRAFFALLVGALALQACQSSSKRSKPSLQETRDVYEAKDSKPPRNADVPGPGAVDPVSPSVGSKEAGAQMPAQETMVAKAAGQSIYAQDLVAAWMFRDSTATREVLDRLVLDALLRAEATRLGVVLPRTLVESDWFLTLEEFESEVKKAEPDMGTDEFIRARLGMDPPMYRQAMAARRTLDLLAKRCVRAFTLENDTVQARLIVAPDRKIADRVEAGLAQGRSFAELAEEYSIDPSGDQGGSIAPVVRSAAPIARLAHATPLGEVGGPLKERGRFLYILAEAQVPAVQGSWAVLGPIVERSLEDRPIQDLEFVQWQAMVLSRYEVDTEPILEFIGQPVR